MIFFLENLSILLCDIRENVSQFCAEQPQTALAFVIFTSTGLLPFITMVALSPLVFVLKLTAFVSENGEFIFLDFYKIL